MGAAVAAAWRWMVIDVRRFGAIDFKWLVFAFLIAAAATWVVREASLRRLQRKNRLLHLLVDVEAANSEPLRRGSDLQIDTDGLP